VRPRHTRHSISSKDGCTARGVTDSHQSLSGAGKHSIDRQMHTERDDAALELPPEAAPAALPVFKKDTRLLPHGLTVDLDAAVHVE
jgi:hypothetical protein